MIPSPKLLLYRYNVAVEPAATGKKLSQLIRLLLGLPGYAEHRDRIVTDFKSTLVSRQRLDLDTAESVVQYRAEGEDAPLPNAQSYRFRVEETGTLPVADLIDYLSSTNVSTNYTEKLPMLQALNIFLGHYAKANPDIATVGSSKSFSLSQDTPRWDLGAGLSALRGFFSSVRLATCRILVNVNVSHGAFYDPVPLVQLMGKSGLGNNPIKLQSFLKRVRVKTTHLEEKRNKAGVTIPRVKTIFALANKTDGASLEHRPRVQRFAAGPKEVEFFLNDSSGAPSSSSAAPGAGKAGAKKKGKGPKGGGSGKDPGPSSSQGGKYISVYEFFRTGKCASIIQTYQFCD